MARSKKKSKRNPAKITKIGVTSDVLTSRGGLNFFSKYIENIQILSVLGMLFGSIRKSKKGQSIETILKQVICNLMNGMSRHLTYFDQLKTDQGYTASLELTSEEMVSSHSVKRFF